MPVNFFGKRMKPLLTASAVVLFAAGLLFCGKAAAAATAQAVQLCLQVLLPALFPFFILSQLTIRTGLAAPVNRLLEKPTQFLFGLPGCCASALFLGMLGGYPVGAKTIAGIYADGCCSREDARRALAFCNNCGPAFLLCAVGSILLGQLRLGILLYIAHILAALTVGILFRKDQHAAKQEELPAQAPQDTLLTAFLDAVSDGFAAFLSVSAFVVFFSVLLALLRQWGVLSRVAALAAACTPLPQLFWDGVLSGLLEMTTGVNAVIYSGAPLLPTLLAVSFLTGWGGCSVHFQTMQLLRRAGLDSRSCWLGKSLQAFFSMGYTLLAIRLFPKSVSVGSFSPAIPVSDAFVRGYLLLSACICILWMLFVGIFYIFHLVNRRRKRYNKHKF